MLEDTKNDKEYTKHQNLNQKLNSIFKGFLPICQNQLKDMIDFTNKLMKK